MATNCTPGYKGSGSDSSNDELHIGCWAEHKDGSLIFIKGVEKKQNRVIYSLYDMSKEPILEFTDSMTIEDFQEFFSYQAESNKKVKGNKWIWHDKTPFLWNKVIKKGARDGQSIASANDILSQADRIANILKLKGSNLNQDEVKDFIDQSNLKKLVNKLKKALKDW